MGSFTCSQLGPEHRHGRPPGGRPLRWWGGHTAGSAPGPQGRCQQTGLLTSSKLQKSTRGQTGSSGKAFLGPLLQLEGGVGGSSYRVRLRVRLRVGPGPAGGTLALVVSCAGGGRCSQLWLFRADIGVWSLCVLLSEVCSNCACMQLFLGP